MDFTHLLHECPLAVLGSHAGYFISSGLSSLWWFPYHSLDSFEEYCYFVVGSFVWLSVMICSELGIWGKCPLHAFQSGAYVLYVLYHWCPWLFYRSRTFPALQKSPFPVHLCLPPQDNHCHLGVPLLGFLSLPINEGCQCLDLYQQNQWNFFFFLQNIMFLRCIPFCFFTVA